MAHVNDGNNYWTRRTKHGRNKAFESADALWARCCEYFEWVEKNPLWESKVVSYQGEGTLVEVPKMRAMTIEGLCLFIGITRETWNQYRREGSGFSDVAHDVDNIIREQKFTGASADLLNANIIARDLGLMDGHKHEMTGADGGPIQTEERNAGDVARRIAFLLAKGVKETGNADD